MTTTLTELQELSDELEVDVTDFLADDGTVDDIEGLVICLHSALED